MVHDLIYSKNYLLASFFLTFLQTELYSDMRKLYKVICGEAFFIASEFKIIPAMGVASIECEIIDSFWTGKMHVNIQGTIVVQISNISQISSRSSLDEDDEEWKVLFRRERKPFSYEYERELENLIKTL